MHGGEGCFFWRWKIFLREKEKLRLHSSGAGGWLLLQRLLEGQIRERKRDMGREVALGRRKRNL